MAWYVTAWYDVCDDFSGVFSSYGVMVFRARFVSVRALVSDIPT